MNPNIYRQADPRWGSLPYPVSSSPVSTDGCGLCAVTHCAIEKDQYKNYTPKDIHSFMRQYAVTGNGTRWDGIDAGLKKYVGNCKRFDDMTAFWNELSKGNRIGVILFRSGSGPDGTVWTSSGHYIAFVGYKLSGGNHWLYMKDSGGRCHDGWFSYEKSMKNCIQFTWTADIRDGWVKESGAWHYYKNGAMLKGEWVKDSDKWYYLEADGTMAASKWLELKNEWYYFESNGVMSANKWIQAAKGWCYVGANGKMLKGKWLRWKNNMYYIKNDGYMQTGSAYILCNFDTNGKLEASV